jgi:acyl-CoA dehydrogenase
LDFEYSETSKRVQSELARFIAEEIAPRDAEWHRIAEHEGRFPPPFIKELKAKAKGRGLWNLFLPGLEPHQPGTRLSNLDYAPCAELMGPYMWAVEVFNCSHPDTGNMETLHQFATAEQKKSWLDPLLAGEIRSAICMTEPDVASSDPTNIHTQIRRDGDEYVINGRKWFITGAADPRCKLLLVMGQTDPERRDPHRSHSVVLVPMDTPGVKVIRNPTVMHHLAAEGHCEITFTDVRVPVTNRLAGEGDGFTIAQARLGPGRIHHCMRSIGQCEHALSLMVERAGKRKTFGNLLQDHGTVMEWIALSRAEIEQARLLVLKTAWLMDREGAKAARREISLIKVIVPRIQTAICNRAIQTFGAAGLTPDTPLAFLWTWGRALQILDGPDEVHLRTIARLEVKDQAKRIG